MIWLQLDPGDAEAHSRAAESTGGVGLKEKDILQLTCIINVKPGESRAGNSQRAQFIAVLTKQQARPFFTEPF
jgi:hypothetical protein